MESINLTDLLNGTHNWSNIPSILREVLIYIVNYIKKNEDVNINNSRLFNSIKKDSNNSNVNINSNRNKIEKIDNDINIMNDKFNTLQSNISINETNINTLLSSYKETNSIIDSIQVKLNKSATSNDISELIPILQRLQNNKAEKQNLNELIALINHNEESIRTLAIKLADISHENDMNLEKLNNNIKDLKVSDKSINKIEVVDHVTKEELSRLLISKVDRTDIKKILSENVLLQSEQDQIRKSTASLIETISSKADLTSVKNTLSDVRDEIYSAIQTLHNNTQIAVDSLKVAIETKAAIEDVDKYVSSKAGPDDIKSVIELIETKPDSTSLVLLDNKYASKVEFEKQLQLQNKINTVLCSEFSTARWIWKCGQLDRGGSVPWNSEVTNTDPHNFLWERNSTAVVAVTGGLYEIEIGFFTSKPGKMTLFINDVPILARESNLPTLLTVSAKKAISTSLIKGPDTKVVAHPDGNILASINLREFVSLPSKALISLTFTGDESSQAFLGLKKL